MNNRKLLESLSREQLIDLLGIYAKTGWRWTASGFSR
jgi:hypothetical protein